MYADLIAARCVELRQLLPSPEALLVRFVGNLKSR